MLTETQKKSLRSVFDHTNTMIRLITDEDPLKLDAPLKDAYFAVNAAWLYLYDGGEN